MGFIYHCDKVSFQGIAGEIVLPEKLLISDVTHKLQFARTPFACAFQSGWLRFMLATVHIYYGSASKKSDAYQRRVKEVESVARFLARQAAREDRTYILVGDFNIEKFGDAIADALERANFTIVRNKEGRNRTQTKFYDQISFWARDGEVRMANMDRANGVLRLFDTLFRDADFDLYDSDVDATLADKIAATRQIRADRNLCEVYYLNEWRTFQLSDHLPLWVELAVDFAEDYLDSR